MPKTLAEIAIDAGLVNRASAAKAGKISDERGQPLVAVLVRELGVDELALVGAIRKQTRVPLMDPGEIQADPDALRLIPRDICARLRALPLGMATDGTIMVLRIAMADPTDTAAIAEIEEITQSEIEICALPLSAIEELVDKGYRAISTVVVSREQSSAGRSRLVTSKAKIAGSDLVEETSVTAQIPLVALQTGAVSSGAAGLERKVEALIRILLGKGLVTEDELAQMLAKLDG